MASIIALSVLQICHAFYVNPRSLENKMNAWKLVFCERRLAYYKYLGYDEVVDYDCGVRIKSLSSVTCSSEMCLATSWLQEFCKQYNWLFQLK